MKLSDMINVKSLKFMKAKTNMAAYHVRVYADICSDDIALTL